MLCKCRIAAAGSHLRTGVQAKEARKKEVCDTLARTGTYEHTFDELQWGARVAWRNNGKSAKRSHWNELMLLDHRTADSPAAMFEVPSASPHVPLA